MSVHAWFADWSLTWWPSLGNHLWQATLFGLAALLVTAFLKTSRSQTRYLILLVVLLKFAVPSMLFVAGVGWLGFQPAVLAPVDGTPESSAGTATELALRIATPLPSTPPPQTIKTGAPHAHSEIYCGLSIFWLLGFASFVAAWAKRRVAVLSEVRQAEVLRDGPLSDAVVEVSRQLGVGQRVRVGISSHSAQPGVWGIRRPIVILPGGITSRLTRGELRSLLTHELAHVKRYDNLVSYFQMLVRSFFWFHPLVWCIDRRLLTEREAACDESVIRRGEAAEDYVAGLLKACRLSVTAPVAGLSRITESNLKTRVERIMSIPHRNPNVFWQRCLVGSALTAAVATSVIVGLLSNRPVLAQQPASADDWLQTAVSYILTDGEKAEFQGLTTTADRKAFIAEFWRRHDPTPETPENEFKKEHDRRVAYSNDRWRSLSGAGWKSDQGRIYIIYGPPDEIEDHPLKFQRWRYREGTFANVILEFSYSSTELQQAIGRGDLAGVRALLAECTDVDERDTYGETALIAAAHTGHKGIVQTFLDAGSNVNAENPYGRTALMAAASRGNPDIVQSLLAAGADVNRKDHQGHTALILAAMIGHPSIAQVLLANGADPHVETERGKTALSLATNSKHTEIIQLLREAGVEK